MIVHSYKVVVFVHVFITHNPRLQSLDFKPYGNTGEMKISGLIDFIRYELPE